MDGFNQGVRAIMAGHGCDEAGPFLLLNDRVSGGQVRFDVRGEDVFAQVLSDASMRGAA